MAITLETVPYRDGHTALTGCLVRDDRTRAPRPGVLVVHGGAGLDDHARGRAQQMASLGYVAFACAMYGDGVAGDRERVMAAIAALRADRRVLHARAMAGVAQLSAHPEVDGRIAAIGYCFGGMTVLEMAREGTDLAAVISVHGTLSTVEPARPGAVRAPILACHGALDPHVPTAQVTVFADEMRDAGADWQLNVYGGAMHGFTHEHADGRMPGVAYHARADARSSVEIAAFLAEAFDRAQGGRS